MGVPRDKKSTSKRAGKPEKLSRRSSKQPEYSAEEKTNPMSWSIDHDYTPSASQLPYDQYEAAYDFSYNDLISQGANVDAYAKEAKTEFNHKIVALGVYPAQSLIAVTKSTAHVLPTSLALILMVLAICNGYGYVKKMTGGWDTCEGSGKGGGSSRRSTGDKSCEETARDEESRVESFVDGGESGGAIIGGGRSAPECSCIGSDDEDTLRDPLLMSCMETPAGENVAIETDCYDTSSASPKSSARGGGLTVSPYDCYETASGSHKSSARGGALTVSPFAWSPSNKSFIPTDIESNEDDEVCSGAGGRSTRYSTLASSGPGYMDATTTSPRSLGGPADATSADVVVDIADELIVHGKTPDQVDTDPLTATDNLQTATASRTPEAEDFMEEDALDDDTLSSTDG